MTREFVPCGEDILGMRVRLVDRDWISAPEGTPGGKRMTDGRWAVPGYGLKGTIVDQGNQDPITVKLDIGTTIVEFRYLLTRVKRE